MKKSITYLLLPLLSAGIAVTQSICVGAQVFPGSGNGSEGASIEPRSQAFLAQAMVAEEIDGNTHDAAQRYQEVIQNFDHQRREAAQAMFRLAEIQRKRGEMGQAAYYYGRILREFPDHPDLAQQALQRLQQAAPSPAAPPPPPPSVDPFLPPPPSKPPQPDSFEDVGAEKRAGESSPIFLDDSTHSQNAVELLREELALVEAELKSKKLLEESGRVSPSEIRQVQREMLQLQQKLAQLQAQPHGDLLSSDTNDTETVGTDLESDLSSTKDKQKDKQKNKQKDKQKETPYVITAESVEFSNLRPEQQELHHRMANIGSQIQGTREELSSLSIRDSQIRNIKVTSLPESVAADPLYTSLKQKYKQAIIQGDETGIENTLRQLEKWKELKLEELQAQQEAIRIRLENLVMTKTQLSEKLSSGQDSSRRGAVWMDRVHPAN